MRYAQGRKLKKMQYLKWMQPGDVQEGENTMTAEIKSCIESKTVDKHVLNHLETAVAA